MAVFLVAGIIVAILIIAIIIAVYYFTTKKNVDIPPAIVYTNQFEEVPDNTIISTKMLDESIAQYWPAFSQEGTAVGTGIPPEFWESTKLTTKEDCTIHLPGNYIVDCTIDPITLPDHQYQGGKTWHMGKCVPVYGGNGICTVGEEIGTGIPGLIRTYQPDTSGMLTSDPRWQSDPDGASNVKCAKDCADDPNCAFNVYTRPQYLYGPDQSLQGTCRHYSVDAYPFRVKMGYPNEGVYTMNIKKSAKPALAAKDQAVKDALQREIDEYNATLGELINYNEKYEYAVSDSCVHAGMKYAGNTMYNPITNWLPTDDVYHCARLCSNSAECKSFVHDNNYGCVLSKYPDMYIVTGHPTEPGLIQSNNRIRCGASYYSKK